MLRNWRAALRMHEVALGDTCNTDQERRRGLRTYESLVGSQDLFHANTPKVGNCSPNSTRRRGTSAGQQWLPQLRIVRHRFFPLPGSGGPLRGHSDLIQVKFILHDLERRHLFHLCSPVLECKLADHEWSSSQDQIRTAGINSVAGITCASTRQSINVFVSTRTSDSQHPTALATTPPFHVLIRECPSSRTGPA